MAHKRKRGPKTPWQNRVRYNRAKCEDRLKPCQIQNLAAADAYASWTGRRLNYFLTVKFSEIATPLAAFREGVKRLSQWHRHWGGELTWLYVWEAVGGPHLHALVFVPSGARQYFLIEVNRAFAGHNVLLKSRTAGPSAMAYLCKGTDLQTHRKLRGPSQLSAKAQGRIAWARCGITQNIGKLARTKAGFETRNHQSNCVKTYSRRLNKDGQAQSPASKPKQEIHNTPSLVVLETTNATAKATAGASYAPEAYSRTSL